MISFSCSNCGKKYEFKTLPIPEGGAMFKCSECGKTCQLIKKGSIIFCVAESSDLPTGETATVDYTEDYSYSAEDALSPDELEARLGGMFPQLPLDTAYRIGVIEGPDRGSTFPIRKAVTTIGKTGCDINLKDPQVSREHCQIEIYENHLTILRDLRSVGGTFRNNYPVALSYLRPGDTITIGKTKLVLLQNPKNLSRHPDRAR